MLIQGQVGANAAKSMSPGTQPPIRLSPLGDQVVSQLLGRHSEATYNKMVFSICNQTGVTHSAALTTTFVGICVGNPAGSDVNVHILQYGWALDIILAAPAVMGIMTGLGTITGALTPRNRLVGGPAGRALATGGMTLPGTPVLEQVFGMGGALATASWEPKSSAQVIIDGSLILPPGSFVASYMSTASGASGFRGGFIWMEAPI